MMAWLAIVVVMLGWAAFVGLCIRADARDEAAYKAWNDDPRHVWNQWKSDCRDAPGSDNG